MIRLQRPSSTEVGQHLGEAWSATDFGDVAIDRYASGLLESETRRGLITLGLLALILHLTVLVFTLTFARGAAHSAPLLWTHGLLALLGTHMAISARWIYEVRILNLLGMALLIVTAAGLMLLAHRLGSFNLALVGGVALLFMALPIMPWGLRESATVIGLVYLLFTASTNSVEGRFDSATLWTLQFLLLASATIATVLIVRNVCVRKHDVRTRYELDSARLEMERLCNVDPLTGAWNRRFLESQFDCIAASSKTNRRTLELAVLDIDHFKHANDTHGHYVGDMVLRTLVDTLRGYLPGDAFVIRLGGDEFAVLYDGGGLMPMIHRCLEHLKTDPELLDALNGVPVQVSAGYAAAQPGTDADIDTLYQSADRKLYDEKSDGRDESFEAARGQSA